MTTGCPSMQCFPCVLPIHGIRPVNIPTNSFQRRNRDTSSTEEIIRPQQGSSAASDNTTSLAGSPIYALPSVLGSTCRSCTMSYILNTPFVPTSLPAQKISDLPILGLVPGRRQPRHQLPWKRSRLTETISVSSFSISLEQLRHLQDLMASTLLRSCAFVRSYFQAKSRSK